MKSHFVELSEVDSNDVPLRIEYRWINPERRDRPLLIFLHEGLGSIAMWKSWPQDLCDAGDFRALLYSRPGYGRSTPRRHDQHWPNDYLQRQAHDVLPALLRRLEIDDGHDVCQQPWLIGHSDGASIALLYAAAFPERLAGAVVMAPHVFVEAFARPGIEAARTAYLEGNLRNKLARYHDDVDSAFWGWNVIWLASSFQNWNIESELRQIRRPLLAIQGHDDEYGTTEQLQRIAQAVPAVVCVEIDDCGHTPHRDCASQVNAAIIDFIGR